MKKIVRLTENDLVRLVKRVIREQNDGIVGPNQEKENLIKADTDARWNVRTKFFTPLEKQFTNKDYTMKGEYETSTLTIREILPDEVVKNGQNVKVDVIGLKGKIILPDGRIVGEEILTLNCNGSNIYSKQLRQYLTNQDLTTKLKEKFCKTFTL